MTPVIRCRDLAPPELHRVGHLEGAITARFAARGIPVRTCYSVGAPEKRILCFGDAGGRLLGSVPSTAFLAAPIGQAADTITVWKD